MPPPLSPAQSVKHIKHRVHLELSLIGARMICLERYAHGVPVVIAHKSSVAQHPGWPAVQELEVRAARVFHQLGREAAGRECSARDFLDSKFTIIMQPSGAQGGAREPAAGIGN